MPQQKKALDAVMYQFWVLDNAPPTPVGGSSAPVISFDYRQLSAGLMSGLEVPNCTSCTEVIIAYMMTFFT